tara:strand:+ start:87 stop:611 length:525 start_codon:yes stop_codon:yes gene_type:complete
MKRLFFIFFIIQLNAQSKKEVRQLKKQLRIEKKIEKQKSLIDEKIVYLKNPFWLEYSEANPSLGIIKFDPRKGYQFGYSNLGTVLQMVRIVSYWIPLVKQIQLSVIDPCGKNKYLNSIIVLISPDELEIIRNFRTKYLDSKNKLAVDYEGAMIPPSLTQKLTNQIIQNCGVYVE